MLIDKKDTFDPFAVVKCPGLPSCAKDPSARAHLENLAKHGFSLVEDVEADEGARMIAEKNVGGVIDKGTITCGLSYLSNIFADTVCKWAVIPSSYHMKLKIAHELANIPLPTPGLFFTFCHDRLRLFVFVFALAWF